MSRTHSPLYSFTEGMEQKLIELLEVSRKEVLEAQRKKTQIEDEAERLRKELRSLEQDVKSRLEHEIREHKREIEFEREAWNVEKEKIVNQQLRSSRLIDDYEKLIHLQEDKVRRWRALFHYFYHNFDFAARFYVSSHVFRKAPY